MEPNDETNPINNPMNFKRLIHRDLILFVVSVLSANAQQSLLC